MGRDVEKGRGANSTLDQINKYLTNLPRHGRSVLSYRLFVAIALAVNTAWVVLIIHQRLSPTLGYYLVPALIIALGLILLGITLFSGFLAQVYGIGAFVCYCGLGTAISSIPPLARKAIWSSPDSVRIALIIGLLSVSLVMSIIGIAVTLALSKNE
ncbi:MAG: hypothetical protein ACRDHZ_07015 [Ktedonobacteraceae bacterium]